MRRPLFRRCCYCPAGCIGACITCAAWHRVLRNVMARRMVRRTAA